MTQTQANVIDLTERRPHAAGIARCIACGFEWQAVAAAGEKWLECPSCGLVKGRMKFRHERGGPHWHCACGCGLFRITPAGLYCPNCGDWQAGY